MCVGCSKERETLEHFILHCPRWEEWWIESRSLHRPRIEETNQVIEEFRFGVHEKENATKDVEWTTDTHQKQPREC